MDGEYHVTCLVREDSFFLGSNVVKELVDIAHSGLCRGRLLGRNGTEGHQHGAIDCTCVIKESTKDLLYVLFTGGIKERLGVFGFRELLLCSILGGMWACGWFCLCLGRSRLKRVRASGM